MNIAKHIHQLQMELPKGVTLVAVSKTKPVTAVQEAYNAGQRTFGENKVQELIEKYEQLPKDIQWHMIGHLQTNKVRYIAPFITLIHGVESAKLLKEINKQAAKNNRTINVLLQVRIAKEETKFGLRESDAQALFDSRDQYSNTQIIGVMGMATFTDNHSQIRSEFLQLYDFFKKLHNISPDIRELSIGMTSDYRIAIECGSTMVRIGSRIFGRRG